MLFFGAELILAYGAQGALVVLRQFFPLLAFLGFVIDIAADVANISHLVRTPFYIGFGFGLGLDGLVIVCVGAGGFIRKHLTFRNFAHEHHMAAQVHLLDDTATEHCIGVLGQIGKTVMTFLYAGESTQLVDVPAGLHSEMPDSLKRHIFCQYADIKFTGMLDHILGQISLLYGDQQPFGLFGHLNAGVDDTAIVDAGLPGGKYKQTVA